MNTIGRLLCGKLEGESPVDVLFVQGANIVTMNPEQGAVIEGVSRPDLFTVVHEQVMTDTARFADVVLPATTHFESDDLRHSYGSYTLQRMSPVIERVGLSRTNGEVAAGLAVRPAIFWPEYASSRKVAGSPSFQGTERHHTGAGDNQRSCLRSVLQ